MRTTSLSNAIRAHRKEVSTVSQPFLPTAPPAGLPAASTVGAKAAVYANVDKRVVSGGAGADGGYMGGATGHAHVAFCLAPRHPPVTPTNQHQARGGRERARERERERETREKERAREDVWRRGFARERLGNRETLFGREEKAVLRDLLVGVLCVPTLLSHRRRAHSPPSALTQTPSPTLWSFPIIARLPPRRYVCCDNTTRAAPSLLSTPSTTSRSRCRCRVERTCLARTCVVGWLRVGWWVLAHGRVGGGGGGGGGEVVVEW